VPSDNAIIIEERLKLLREYVRDLRAEQDITFDRYREDKKLRRFVERTLQIAVEACLDIGNHVIAGERFRYPEDNADIFRVLHEEGIISDDLLTQLVKMAGFRNIVVRGYAKIDDAAVYGAFKKRLEDFEEFALAIVTYLEKDTA
jgi:uncharacterized protein YutE (UPF0331/DUF86 family)